MNFQSITENYVLRLYLGHWVTTYEPDTCNSNLMTVEVDDGEDTQIEVNADAPVAFYSDGRFDVQAADGQMVTFVAYQRVDWDRVLSEEIAGG